MKHPDLSRWAPPGFPWEHEARLFAAGMALSALASLSYISRYSDAYQSLFFRERVNGEVVRRLIPGEFIAPFSELLGNALLGFVILALCLLAAGFWHYAYYRQGSMSIYLMRRLPDRGLLHRQCWTLPLLGLALTALAALCLLGIYYLVYILRTPAVCLPAGF